MEAKIDTNSSSLLVMLHFRVSKNHDLLPPPPPPYLRAQTDGYDHHPSLCVPDAPWRRAI